MKANVFVYRTNCDVVRMHVAHPEVGPCENGNRVGIFDHCHNEYDDWYEDVVLYWVSEVAAIYVNGKCEWHNPAYIKDNTSMKKSQEELYSESLDIDVDEEYVEGMFDYDGQDPLYC